MLLAGCSHFGADAVHRSRMDYNIAIAQTNSEQLLLNLVRLKYRDTPFFMETASISTSFSFGAGLEFSASLLPSVADSYEISPSIGYSEMPTITYMPLQGDQFVKSMMTPLDISILALLYHSGWSIDRVLRVTVQYLNGIPNAPTASGPTPEIVPEYQEFNTVSALIRRLQQQNAITLGISDKEKALVFRIMPEKHGSADVQTLLKILNLDKETLQFPIVSGIGISDKQVTITLRPLIASMFYLSQAVQVPEFHQKLGKVTATKDETGQLFDWHKVTEDLFKIHSSESQPQSAYVAVRYRGAWFYIDDNDLTSKSTFSLLTQLLALQAGESKSVAPILTIPIAP